jgi:putative membrane protein
MTLTDGEIAMVADVVNTGEIEQGQLARTKARNASVKKFAAHMIQQHTKAKQKGAALAKKAKITPEESPVSGQITGKAVAQVDALKAAAPAEFDVLYIHGQLMAHEEVLTLLKSQLIPGATDEGLKSHLAETQTMVETHVADAQAIQAELAAANPQVVGSDQAAPTSSAAGSMDAGQ